MITWQRYLEATWLWSPRKYILSPSIVAGVEINEGLGSFLYSFMFHDIYIGEALVSNCRGADKKNRQSLRSSQSDTVDNKFKEGIGSSLR